MKQKPLAKEIENLSTTIDVSAGETLCREGELAREAMLIVDGSAEVLRDGEQVATVGTGELVGELALDNDDHMRTATVRATSYCVVAVMSAREFATLRRSSKQFAALLDATIDART
jgi:CRP-like cAMP-binding protein